MDTTCTDSDTLAIVASGASINDYINKFKEYLPTIDTLSLGHHTFNYFNNILNFLPTFWTYYDAYSTVSVFPSLLDIGHNIPIRIFILTPIHTKSYAVQVEYIGKSSVGQRKLKEKYVKWDSSYYDKQYLANMKKLEQFCDVQYIPATSFKKVNYSRYRKLVTTDDRFLTIMEFTKIFKENTNTKKLCVMEMWEVGRLTTYLLPLVYFLTLTGQFKYSKILLIGFDGNAPRFVTQKFESKREQQLAKVRHAEYKFYMPMWKSIFAELGIKIYKATPSPAMECIEEYHV